MLAVLTALAMAAGCTQISTPDDSIQVNHAATTTVNISDSLSTITLNPTLLTEGLGVQAAMDLWMTESDEWPSALEEPNDDLAATEPALAPTYLKIATLRCKYTWYSQGHTRQHC